MTKNKIRKTVQAAIRRLLSWEVMRIGEHAYAAMPSAMLHEAWFSLEVQRKLVLQRQQVDLVLDVGANVGQFVQAIRRVYGGDVISFEPSSAPLAQLQQVAGRDARWQVHGFALGAEDTWLDLQISPLSVLNSFLPPSAFGQATFGERGRPAGTERVQVRRLDSFMAGQPPLAARKVFVKLDTQGFDLNVFAGMAGLLDQVVGIQSEVSLRALYVDMPGWLDSLAVYQDAGFRVIGMFPAATDAQGMPIEFDCLMVRSDHLSQPERPPQQRM